MTCVWGIKYESINVKPETTDGKQKAYFTVPVF